jgi:phosphoglycolate phosphatase-like HAD superfamily hydrolase
MMPKVLALDFDGVLCDGLAEYFYSTQLAYGQLIPPTDGLDLNAWKESFYHWRPIIETGWEMIVLLRALVLHRSEAEILHHWPSVVTQILKEEGWEPHQLMQLLDAVRDRQIQENVTHWLGLHRFYPGVIDRLKVLVGSETQVYIITTKEGRFVQTLLAEQGVNLTPQQIIGKEIQQPKYQTLTQLLQHHQILPQELWFVEDLLKTLQKIQQKETLKDIVLFLAEWGYNRPADREFIKTQSSIYSLSLAQFILDFPQWLIPLP